MTLYSILIPLALALLGSPEPLRPAPMPAPLTMPATTPGQPSEYNDALVFTTPVGHLEGRYTR